jgi:hypothetical protein
MPDVRVARPLLEDNTMKHSYSQPQAVEPMVGAQYAARTLALPLHFFTKPSSRASKRIPHYRVGQMVRFRISELSTWAATQGVTHE